MIIKINNQLYQQKQPKVFEQTNINKVTNQTTFRCKLLPNPNYFTILHHIINRNTPIKQIFKQFSQDQQQKQIYKIDQKGINLKTSKKLTKRKSLQNKSQLSLTQISQSFRYSHRPKWKDSILRRKNNGSNGQIIKGKSQNHYSCIINRLNNQYQETPKLIQDFNQSKFAPLGKLYPKNNKFISLQQKRKKMQEILNGQTYNFPIQVIQRNQHFKKMKKKKKVNIKFGSNYLNKTFAPLNSNSDRGPTERRSIKMILSNALICLPRGFTPRPWQTVQP